MNILIVDDDGISRSRLIKGLRKNGFKNEEISGAASGEEALRLVKEKPGFYHVAVIDQQLGEGIDGIETTRRVCGQEHDIFPIIFTNIPSDNPNTIEKMRARVYDAGGYRYMYKGEERNEASKIKDFVDEIRQLIILRERVQSFYKTHQTSPSLLTQLDIMVSLIDRGHKIWYMNDANKQFKKLGILPRKACSFVFNQKEAPPCMGCITAQTFQDGENRERIYLRMPIVGSPQIRWLYSWTQPMPDENGKPILLSDGKPAAVLESSQDITDSDRLLKMPLKERMHHIALALNESHNGFDRVRIYKADPTGKHLTLIAHHGYEKEVKSAMINVSDFTNIKHSIRHFRKKNEGQFYQIQENMDPIYAQDKMERFIHWPLLRGEKFLGLLSVSPIGNAEKFNEDKIEHLKPYAEEALKAIEVKGEAPENYEIEKITSEIDNRLISIKTPEGRLQTLVDDIQRITESDSVYLRYREGDTAKLVPIGKGSYHRVAPLELSLSDHNTPAVRAILSGRREIYANATTDPKMVAFAKSLPEEAAKALENVDSFCFEPLIFQNRCIGSLMLMKIEKNHYTDQLIEMIKKVARRISLALHDYLVSVDRMIKDYVFESSINALVVTDLNGKISHMNPSFLKLWGYENMDEILNQILEILWQKENVSEMLEVLRAKGTHKEEIIAQKKSGSLFDVELYANIVKDKNDNPVGILASFIDITERKRFEKIQKAIYEISEITHSAKNLPDLYKNIHEIIKRLIQANNFYIALYNEDTKVIQFPYFKDQKDKKPKARKFGNGLTEYVIRTGQPLFAPYKKLKELNEKREIEFVGTESIDWLGVPLKTRSDKTIGVLAVQAYEEGIRYDEKDKDILAFVSTQIAMAIEHKRAEQIKVSVEEIHHRVKNNLATVSSLLSLQIKNSINNEETIKILQASKNRIKTMALIHEILYKKGDDFSEVNSQEYINNLITHLKSIFDSESHITLKLDIESIQINLDVAQACGLIINELVTNAFKHAFPNRKNGQITVEFYKRQDGLITLAVSDNGVGFPKENKIKSLGLRLVEIQAENQLDGQLIIDNTQGTRFEITFDYKD